LIAEIDSTAFEEGGGRGGAKPSQAAPRPKPRLLPAPVPPPRRKPVAY
jgi:hypothetical protein